MVPTPTMTWLHKGESVLQIPEVLSPAGDRERLEAAVRYGADAVYLGGSQFGMRAALVVSS